MNPTSHTTKGFLPKTKLFLALSRTPHGLVDLATPVLAALLALGSFPPFPVLIVGLITGFAGYTAVYSLNDVIDFPIDKKKLQEGGLDDSIDYLDAVMIRHPIAKGILSLKSGVIWTAAWGTVALLGAYFLNPVCVLIFLFGCVLEMTYCLMWAASYLRTVVSGVVKTCGGIAAVFAVQPDPGLPFLMALFFWLFFWEIGGQNIPADWTDIEEDRKIGAKTIPAQLGVETANRVILGSLLTAVLISLGLFTIAQVGARFFVFPLVALVGIFFLLTPAWSLFKTRQRGDAMALFNKASHYPLALLVMVVVMLLF